MATPSIIFGCASIGKSYTSQEEVTDLLSTLQNSGINHLDTAARYPPTLPGRSEELLGAALAADSFTIDTKILVSGDGRGHLEESLIGESIERSFQSLKTSKIDVLYCHAPDKQTPIADQAAAFDRHYREGKFEYVGIRYTKKERCLILI